MRSPNEVDVDDINDVVQTFFEAFASGEGCEERLDALPALFLPGATVIRVLDGATTLYDVAGFISPRRDLLTGGSLTGFREWHVDGRTDVFGDIAQHWCTYAKGWTEGGVLRSGAGAKSFQLVRTDGAWRVSALVWNDKPDRP